MYIAYKSWFLNVCTYARGLPFQGISTLKFMCFDIDWSSSLRHKREEVICRRITNHSSSESTPHVTYMLLHLRFQTLFCILNVKLARLCTCSFLNNNSCPIVSFIGACKAVLICRLSAVAL